MAEPGSPTQVLIGPLSSERPASVLAAASGDRRCRRGLTVGLKLLVSALIIAYLVRTQRLEVTRIKHAWHSPLHLWVALGVLLLLPFLLTLRWQVLLRALQYRLPYQNMLGLTFMAVFFDSIIPGGAADVIRGYYLDRNFQLQHRARALSTVVVDRFLGVMGLVLSALAALVFKGHTALARNVMRPLTMGTAAAGLAFILVFLFLASKNNVGRDLLERLCSHITELKLPMHVYDASRSYANKSRAMLQALFLSLVGNAFTIIVFVLLGSALSESHLKFVDYFCLVPLGLFIAQIPISPGGIGVGHLGFYSLFQMAGSRYGAEIFSMFIVVRFLSGLPGLFCFLLNRGKTDAKQRIGIAPPETNEQRGQEVAPHWASAVATHRNN
jgi:glycosyltransferase 2 family protein